MKLMKFEKEEIVDIVLLIITGALLYNIYMIPQARQVKCIRSQYTAAKELLRAREAKREELETLRMENLRWMDKLEIIENRFLNRDEINSFLKDMILLAEEARVRLQAIDLLERSSPAELGIEKAFVRVTVVGRYPSIIDFLNMIENNEKLLDVSEVKIGSSRSGEQDLEASFVLTLFVIEAEGW